MGHPGQRELTLVGTRPFCTRSRHSSRNPPTEDDYRKQVWRTGTFPGYLAWSAFLEWDPGSVKTTEKSQEDNVELKFNFFLSSLDSSLIHGQKLLQVYDFLTFLFVPENISLSTKPRPHQIFLNLLSMNFLTFTVGEMIETVSINCFKIK